MYPFQFLLDIFDLLRLLMSCNVSLYNLNRQLINLLVLRLDQAIELASHLGPLTSPQNGQNGVVFNNLVGCLHILLQLLNFSRLFLHDFLVLDDALLKLIVLILLLLDCNFKLNEFLVNQGRPVLCLVKFSNLLLQISDNLVKLFIFFFESVLQFLVLFLLLQILPHYIDFHQQLIHCFLSAVRLDPQIAILALQ